MGWQNYLDARLEHPKLLKDSKPYSQALRIKLICSSQQELLSRTAKMLNQFEKRGYNRSLLEQKFDKANLQETTTFKRKKERNYHKSPFIVQAQYNTL